MQTNQEREAARIKKVKLTNENQRDESPKINLFEDQQEYIDQMYKLRFKIDEKQGEVIHYGNRPELILEHKNDVTK